MHFDNEEGATDQFHQSDRCVTANTSGIPAHTIQKPRDTGAPASFRNVELATAIARLFARCRAICTHERTLSLEKISVKIFCEALFVLNSFKPVRNLIRRNLNLKAKTISTLKEKSNKYWLKISQIL